MDKLKLGNAIIEFAQPPPGFDVIKASDEDLKKYGFSPRPKDTAALTHWEGRGRLKRVPPEFDLTPKCARQAAPIVSDAAGTMASPTWSGSLLRPPAGVGVAGVWGYVWPPINFGGYTNGKFAGLLFAGIGGFPATCLFQAGVYFEVDIGNGAPTPTWSYRFWYEWFPATSGHTLTNPTVQGGVPCEVSLTVNSPVSGSVYLANLATATSTQFTVTVPDVPQNHVATDSAEWIFERLDPNICLFPLFGPMFYADGSPPGAWFTNGGGGSINSGTLIEMWDAGKQLTQVHGFGSPFGDALTIIGTPTRP